MHFGIAARNIGVSFKRADDFSEACFDITLRLPWRASFIKLVLHNNIASYRVEFIDQGTRDTFRERDCLDVERPMAFNLDYTMNRCHPIRWPRAYGLGDQFCNQLWVVAEVCAKDFNANSRIYMRYKVFHVSTF